MTAIGVGFERMISFVLSNLVQTAKDDGREES